MRVDGVERARLVKNLRAWLGSRTEILLAYGHGSFFAGGPYRDIDVAVWLESGQVGPEEWPSYALDRSIDLRIALGMPVDVQVLNAASIAFRYHAMGGQPLLVRDEALRVEILARTWDNYLDFLPFARRYLQEILS
jgi:uncharacterized protein